MELLAEVRVGRDAPIIGKVYQFSEDEYVADDAEGHRIPSKAHPQGYWPTYLEAFDAVICNAYPGMLR